MSAGPAALAQNQLNDPQRINESSSSYPPLSPHSPYPTSMHSPGISYMEELEKTSRGGRPGYGPTTKSQELRVGGGGPGTTPGGDENVSFFRGILLELNTRNQRIFLGAIFIQAVVVLGMIILVYASVKNAIGDVSLNDLFPTDSQLETVTTYLSLFVVAELFEIVVTLEALLQKNIMQIANITAFQVALLVYSAVLPGQLHNALVGSLPEAEDPNLQPHVRIFSIIIPSFIGLVTLIMAATVRPLFKEFGWAVFKKIGRADIRLRKMYRQWEILVCLLKFDAFFFIGFSVQFLVLVSGTSVAERVITIVALPIIVIFLALTGYVVKIENKPGTYAMMFLQLLGMVYFIYKLVRIYDSPKYGSAKSSLTIFSVLSLIILLATMAMTFVTYRNFGLGLKENQPPYTLGRQKRQQASSGAGSAGGVSKQDTRMSLE